MKKHYRIHIDLDATCKGCGDKGATPSGLCLVCIGDQADWKPGGIAETLEQLEREAEAREGETC